MKRTIAALFFIVIFSLLAYIDVLQLFNSSLSPLYSDELTYLLSTTRFSLDGYTRLAAGLMCHIGHGMTLPWLVQIPATVLNPLGHIQHFLYFRLIACCIILLGVGLLLLTAKKFGFMTSAQGGMKLALLLAFLLNVMTFTPASVALVLWRGEYALFLMVPTFLYLSSLQTNSRLASCGVYILSFVLFSCACYVHSKSLFFLPFVLLFVWQFYQNQRSWLRTLLLLPFLAFSYQMVTVNDQQLIDCPNTPWIAQQNTSFLINPIDLLKGKTTTWQHLGDNVSVHAVREWFNAAFFRPNAPSTTTLPAFHEAHSAAERYSYQLANGLIAINALLLVIGHSWLIYRARHQTLRHAMLLRLSLLGSACIVAYSALCTLHVFYNVATLMYIVSLCMAFGLLATVAPDTAILSQRRWRFSVYSLLVLLMLSHAVGWFIGTRHSTITPHASSHPMMPAPQRIQHLLPLCGPIGPTSHFIIDDATYFSLSPYPHPVEINWLWVLFNLQTHYQHHTLTSSQHDQYIWRSLLSFMHQQHITAMVVACTSLEPYGDSHAIIQEPRVPKNQAFCCVPGS